MTDHRLKRSFRSKDGAPFVIFLILSLVINGVGAYCGWWLKFPEPASQKDDATELSMVDTNDVEMRGDPNAQEEPPPPEPEQPAPPEPAPTPPPLDKPPEFEIPEATPIPAPGSANSPKPRLGPRPQPAVKPRGTPNPHAASVPGLKGSPTGAQDGTGNGGRSGLLVRSPRPPYPALALQMHITGNVRVRIVVQSGNVVEAEGSSGPPMLANAAAWFVRANWKFSPATTGTYTLPVSFVLAQ
jgi:outer membrane biosynthesis protein TonB